MADAVARRSVLRPRRGHEDSRVTFLELFFDLVFVFAVTQLSHLLLAHLSLSGVIQTTLLLMAVWWVWIFTSWVTNWLNPDRAPVRLMLIVLMLAGLVLSTSLPEAFESRGLAFAGAYVFMQVGRSLFMLWALGDQSAANRRNFQRITVWLSLAGVLWIAGGLAEQSARLGLWAAALLVEYLSPSVGFWTPRLGRSTTADWDIEGGHIAERCGLFIIIALGESILVTGATFGGLPWTPATALAFVTAFVGSVAMWWIYFNIGAERGSRLIASTADPGRLARLAYTYVHLPIVAGIIVGAVADELVLAHPAGHSSPGMIATLLGGPALYLAGNILFKRATAERLPLSHLGGLVLLALIAPLATLASPLATAVAATLVLIVVAAWEWRSLGAREVAASKV
jgi:low temperature requirement protein LtrA